MCRAFITRVLRWTFISFNLFAACPFSIQHKYIMNLCALYLNSARGMFDKHVLFETFGLFNSNILTSIWPKMSKFHAYISKRIQCIYLCFANSITCSRQIFNYLPINFTARKYASTFCFGQSCSVNVYIRFSVKIW